MSRAADDDYDDRPRRRPRDDDDDYDDRPRRAGASGGGGGAGKTILIIAAVLFGGLIVCGGIGAALLLPAVAKVREAAARAKDMNNYKQIALGLHAYSDTNGQFPKADDELSWRVAVLPYVEQHTLHRQFDLNQRWDAGKNRALADTVVPTYVSTLDGEGFAQTHSRVFTGPDTVFPPGERPLRAAEVRDGLSNTLLVVEAAETVPWPQPRELAFAKGGALPALGHPQRPTGFLVSMGDGSVRFVTKSVSEASIRAAITANGKEPPPDF